VIDPPVAGLTDQFTLVLLLFVTVAVNVAVCGGQVLPARPLANRVAPEGLTLTATGGVLELLPQATRRPMSASDTHRPAIAEYLNILRPINPIMTMPASGNVRGSHGERLSAKGLPFLVPPILLGPLVVMVRVTCCGDEAPWAIELKPQLTVASGKPLQAKVTAAVNAKLPAVATLKVEVVVSPAGTDAGGVGVDRVKV
jgi:hypothetical protein